MPPDEFQDLVELSLSGVTGGSTDLLDIVAKSDDDIDVDPVYTDRANWDGSVEGYIELRGGIDALKQDRRIK